MRSVHTSEEAPGTDRVTLSGVVSVGEYMGRITSIYLPNNGIGYHEKRLTTSHASEWYFWNPI